MLQVGRVSRAMPRVLMLVILAGVMACSRYRPPVSATPVASPPPAPRIVVETLTVRDPELDRRAARLELTLWEREAQIEVLERSLQDTRQEVVRAMARIQTLATRAEAASGMAEVDVALQMLGDAQESAVQQAMQLMAQSSAEFDKQNYAGALYLANQARELAAQGRRRLSVAEQGALRQGEVVFALPLTIRTTSRGNVREGPGTNYAVLYTTEDASRLTALSHLGDWIRVSDEGGRTGWISRGLVDRGTDGAR
jgi:hypothetical protein